MELDSFDSNNVEEMGEDELFLVAELIRIFSTPSGRNLISQVFRNPSFFLLLIDL